MLLISRSSHPHEHLFHGYAFVGPDYINGTEGALSFQRDKGRTLGPGEDGCYVVAQRSGRELLIGTDAQGLGRLFLYRTADDWVICSSFSGLVDHLRETGKRLTLVPTRLRPAGVRSSFTMQLSTFASPFDEIRLLPIGTSVRIVEDEITFIREPEYPRTYEQALAEYLEIWRSRTLTFARDPRVTFRSDLTGGIDSRCVMAFLLESNLADTNRDRFVVNSTKTQPTDLAVATQLSGVYGLPLNRRIEERQVILSGERAYQHWREHCLGVYGPAYIQERLRGPLEIQAHGAGGGTIRQVYSSESPVSLALQIGEKMSGDAREQWVRDMVETEILLSSLSDGVTTDIQHYTEFRNRFHFGHMPMAKPLFMPLNSKYATAALKALEVDDRRQFYFDVMESLVPGLKDHPYDDERKRPSNDNIRNLTTPALRSAEPGSIYAGDFKSMNNPADPITNGFNLWLRDASRAISSEPVQAFVGRAALRDFEKLLSGALNAGRPYHSHSAEALHISYLVLLGFMLEG